MKNKFVLMEENDVISKSLKQASLMREAITEGNIEEVIKMAIGLLDLLCTSTLDLQTYTSLFFNMLADLRELEEFFRVVQSGGIKIWPLYKRMQYCPRVITRLYLSITLGAILIECMEVPSREILRDIIIQTKCIQHPTKGLFLRYYMIKALKDKFPDTGSKYEGEGGNVEDCINLLIQNLYEMNKLWIRISIVHPREKERRMGERRELSTLVSESLVQIGNLQGVNLEMYQKLIQPKLLGLIQNCKDELSQQYLIDFLIQAFPEEYHIETFQVILELTKMLHPAVDIKLIVIVLLEKFTNYASNPDNADSKLDIEEKIYIVLRGFIENLLGEQGVIAEPTKLMEMISAFMAFTIQVHPTRIDYVEENLISCKRIMELQPGKSSQYSCLQILAKILCYPLSYLSHEVLLSANFSLLRAALPKDLLVLLSQNVFYSLEKYQKDILDSKKVFSLFSLFLPTLDIQGNDYIDPETGNSLENISKVIRLIKCENISARIKAFKQILEFLLESNSLNCKILLKSLALSIIQCKEGIEPKSELDSQIQALYMEVLYHIKQLDPEEANSIFLEFKSKLKQEQEKFNASYLPIKVKIFNVKIQLI